MSRKIPEVPSPKESRLDGLVWFILDTYVRTKGKEVDPKSLTNSDKEDITRTLRKLGCEPLWIDLSVEKQFFDGYCKQVLWPTLHNVLSLYGPIWNRELSLNTRQISTFSMRIEM